MISPRLDQFSLCSSSAWRYLTPLDTSMRAEILGERTCVSVSENPKWAGRLRASTNMAAGPARTSIHGEFLPNSDVDGRLARQSVIP